MTRQFWLKGLYSILFGSTPSGLTQTHDAPKPLQGNPTYFWLGWSLGMALIYGLLSLQQAFSSEYVVQDDARQHVFWMARFFDPTLFSDDVIADYFQSVAPVGYQMIYRIAGWFDFTPLLFHKFLPVGLNLLTAGLCFRVCLAIFPLPSAAFCSSLLLGQGLGLTDAIVSGTPKAFIYPVFLLCMDGIVRQSWMTTWIGIALAGWFYPQVVIMIAGVLGLRLLKWRGGPRQDVKGPRPRWFPLRWVTGRDRILCLGGLLVAALVLLPYVLQTSEFGPTLTLADARQLPELALDGSRSRFFYDGDPSAYWLSGRSGLRLATIFTPVTNSLGLLLVALPWLAPQTWLKRHVKAEIVLLPQIVVSSLGCFLLAHVFLFRLHLPSRYTQHSLRVVASMAASIVIVSLLQWLLPEERSMFVKQGHQGTRGQNRPILGKAGAIALAGGLAISVLCYPMWVDQFPLTGYQVGQYPKLYQFLEQQPNSTVVASLANEINNIPAFTQRSIVSGSEYAIPYHVGYYRQVRQRTVDLIAAQYSTDQRTLRRVIKTYGITFWLLDKNAFKPKYLQNNQWINQHPKAQQAAVVALQSKKRSHLRQQGRSCQVLIEKDLILLDAPCLVKG